MRKYPITNLHVVVLGATICTDWRFFSSPPPFSTMDKFDDLSSQMAVAVWPVASELAKRRSLYCDSGWGVDVGAERRARRKELAAVVTVCEILGCPAFFTFSPALCFL